MKDIFDVFLAFAKVGLFGFGGGPSMIPLIEQEVVGAQGWLTPTEFLDAFAFGNSLPGPIATKLAGYVGYEVAGVAGAVSGLLGVTVPTMIAMIALASLFKRVEKHWAAVSFLNGVRPIIVALLALVVWEFTPSAFQAYGGWSTVLPLAMAGLTALLTIRRSVHPIACIALGGVVGLVVHL